MKNKQKFEYSRFHMHPYNGKDIHVCLIDNYNEGLTHGDKSEEVVHTISEYTSLGKIDGVITHRINAYTTSIESRLEMVKELYEQGLCHVLSISMHGFKLDTTKTKELYDYLSERVFIIASSGNTGTEQYNFPASSDKCLSVGACDLATKTNNPYWLGYSTRNDRIDIANFSNITISLQEGRDSFDGDFGGTSTSCPYTSGQICKLMQWFIQTYGRRPSHKETNSMIMNFCEPVYVNNQLLEVPNVYVGLGVPRLPLRFYDSWSSIHMSYLEEKLGCNSIFVDYEEDARGNFRSRKIRNSYLQAGDFKVKVTRFEQIRLLANCLGQHNELSPNGFVEYCKSKGCIINGKEINGEVTMAFGDIMSRAEMVAFLAKADIGLKGKTLNVLENPSNEWIKEYLEERKVGFLYDTIKDKWIWKYYAYYTNVMGNELSSFDCDRKVQRAEMVKMTALAFNFI